VKKPEIRERVVNEILANIDVDLAARVALALGLPKPKAGKKAGKPDPATSPALSLLNRAQPGIKTRKIALLAAPGADAATLKTVRDALAKEGATALVVAPTLAPIDGVVPDATIAGMPSVMFDAVFVTGGETASQTLAQSGDARHFVAEAFRHLKALAAIDTGRLLLAAAVARAGGRRGARRRIGPQGRAEGVYRGGRPASYLDARGAGGIGAGMMAAGARQQRQARRR
jgi:catalase